MRKCLHAGVHVHTCVMHAGITSSFTCMCASTLLQPIQGREREREERNLDKYAHPLEPRIHETNKRYVHMSLPHLHALSAINPQPSAPRKALKAPSKALLKPRKALSKPPEDRCRVAEHRSLEYRPCCQNLGPNEPL